MKNLMNVVSIHSQKGGTGKTTLALNLAMEADKRGFKPLLIDADLSGTSIRDMIHLKDALPERSINKYFRDPTVQDPLAYYTTAEITDKQSNSSHVISVLLSDPETNERMMPLVYKENHSQYLRTRLEHFIEELAIRELVNVIIIDNSPGSWGLTKAIFEIVTGKVLRGNDSIKINGSPLLISTLDLNDISSCLRTLQEHTGKKREASTGQGAVGATTPSAPSPQPLSTPAIQETQTGAVVAAHAPTPQPESTTTPESGKKTGDYIFILNKSNPVLTRDISKNAEMIAKNLDDKGTALQSTKYIPLASLLRSVKFDWVGSNEPRLADAFQSHTRGIYPLDGISSLVDLLKWVK